MYEMREIYLKCRNVVGFDSQIVVQVWGVVTYIIGDTQDLRKCMR